MILKLTDTQAQSVMQLADAAVRAGGLQFARQAVMLMDIMDAAAASPADAPGDAPHHEDQSDA